MLLSLSGSYYFVQAVGPASADHLTTDQASILPEILVFGLGSSRNQIQLQTVGHGSNCRVGQVIRSADLPKIDLTNPTAGAIDSILRFDQRIHMFCSASRVLTCSSTDTQRMRDLGFLHTRTSSKARVRAALCTSYLPCQGLRKSNWRNSCANSSGSVTTRFFVAS